MDLTDSIGCRLNGELPRYTPMLHDPSLSGWHPAAAPMCRLYGENANHAKRLPTNTKKSVVQKKYKNAKERPHPRCCSLSWHFEHKPYEDHLHRHLHLLLISHQSPPAAALGLNVLFIVENLIGVQPIVVSTPSWSRNHFVTSLSTCKPSF